MSVKQVAAYTGAGLLALGATAATLSILTSWVSGAQDEQAFVAQVVEEYPDAGLLGTESLLEGGLVICEGFDRYGMGEFAPMMVELIAESDYPEFTGVIIRSSLDNLCSEYKSGFYRFLADY